MNEFAEILNQFIANVIAYTFFCNAGSKAGPRRSSGTPLDDE